MPSQQAKLHANANHCLVKQAYYHRKNQNKVIPVEQTRSILEKKVTFSKFSHLNEIYAFRYQIRERHACTRGQLTWLDCFEQKYISIYISFSGKPFLKTGVDIYVHRASLNLLQHMLHTVQSCPVLLLSLC